MVAVYGGHYCPIRVPSRFKPYTATAQLTLYLTLFYGCIQLYMTVNMVTTVYQFYTIIIFYYNVRSTARGWQDTDFKWDGKSVL